jgi:hypothetical protein
LPGSPSLETLQVFLNPAVDRLCHHALLPSQSLRFRRGSAGYPVAAANREESGLDIIAQDCPGDARRLIRQGYGDNQALTAAA